eukprot:TRINITY_DN1308_c0_g1_i1.p1 TRINITY_DN1308_c0_g1~~TRINITY_DN1308_c0_g1_i1.p1  ORF type:complete len:106 (+),score=31.06 TRINITY_DN1308_c0_g1_i1:88-405(+)
MVLDGRVGAWSEEKPVDGSLTEAVEKLKPEVTAAHSSFTQLKPISYISRGAAGPMAGTCHLIKVQTGDDKFAFLKVFYSMPPIHGPRWEVREGVSEGDKVQPWFE